MDRNQKQTPKARNWIAVHAFARSGAGKHHTRTRDVAKGKSRKPKHKKPVE